MEIPDDDSHFIAGGMCFHQGWDTKEKHLWFVISAPEDSKSHPVICGNFTTFHPEKNPNSVYNDSTTIVRKEEHPTLTNPLSCVCYKGFLPPLSYYDFVAKFNMGGVEGFVRRDPPLSPELLQRIRKGVEVSQYSSWPAIGVLRDQGLI